MSKKLSRCIALVAILTLTLGAGAALVPAPRADAADALGSVAVGFAEALGEALGTSPLVKPIGATACDVWSVTRLVLARVVAVPT